MCNASVSRYAFLCRPPRALTGESRSNCPAHLISIELRISSHQLALAFDRWSNQTQSFPIVFHSTISLINHRPSQSVFSNHLFFNHFSFNSLFSSFFLFIFWPPFCSFPVSTNAFQLYQSVCVCVFYSSASTTSKSWITLTLLAASPNPVLRSIVNECLLNLPNIRQSRTTFVRPQCHPLRFRLRRLQPLRRTPEFRHKWRRLILYNLTKVTSS